MESSQHQICSNCILDTKDDPNIIFDEEGICNYCQTYWEMEKKQLIRGEEGKRKVKELADWIKKAGKGKNYDCVIGLSGGVDSTYTAYFVKNIMGLRPLAVHLDNGWNSELAVHNIEQIVKTLDIELYTYVLNWEEFKDLQLAYLNASVVDVEIPTDNAIIGALYQAALKHRVRYVITGHNLASEGVLPPHWVHHKYDMMNFKAIHRRFGKLKLKTFPALGYQRKVFLEKTGLIRLVNILDYSDYNPDDAKQLITEQLKWRDYGWKHFESVFTRFYQGYILPVKFKIDKRKSHLSTLICSGQLKRSVALDMIKAPIYDEELLRHDKQYVIKKFGLSEEEFERIMKLQVKSHTDYPSIMNIYEKIKPVWRLFKTITGQYRRD